MEDTDRIRRGYLSVIDLRLAGRAACSHTCRRVGDPAGKQSKAVASSGAFTLCRNMHFTLTARVFRRIISKPNFRLVGLLSFLPLLLRLLDVDFYFASPTESGRV